MIDSANWSNAGKPERASPNNDLYKRHKWKKFSRNYKNRNPICHNCIKVDRPTPSVVTDHIIPVKANGAVWDERNLQALCRSCDNRKRRMERDGNWTIFILEPDPSQGYVRDIPGITSAGTGLPKADKNKNRAIPEHGLRHSLVAVRHGSGLIPGGDFKHF